jgi:predicted permease
VGRFWELALPELAGMSGVEAVGIGSGVPPDNPGITNNFDLVDRPVPSGNAQPVVPWLIVSPGFLEALGVGVVKGRLPDATDTADDPPVAAVSERWAARFYPGEDVLGRQLYSGGDRNNPVTVVGVVGDVKYLGLASDDESAVYQSYAQNSWRSINLVIRGSVAPPTAEQLRRQFAALDPEVPLTEIQTLNQRLSASVTRPRYWATLVGVFAGVGMVLAAVGIYGVLSYHVSRQARDIGIRMALGAEAGEVRRMVVRQGLSKALLGLAVGVGAALYLTRWLEGLLFQVSPSDPLTFVAVSGFLLAIALAACYWPARRATRVDPVTVLAEE